MSLFKAQYVKSTHPEVVKTIKHNKEGEQEVIQKILDFCERFGAEGWYRGGWGRTTTLGSIILREKPEPSEEWAWSSSRKGVRPKKGSPLWDEYRSLVFISDLVPGMPADFSGTHPTEADASLWMAPHPFVRNDVAYVGLSVFPDVRGEFDSEFWEECLSSELHGAHDS